MLLAEITDAAITGGAAGGPLIAYLLIKEMVLGKRKNGSPSSSMAVGERLGEEKAWQQNVSEALKKQSGLLERIKDEIIRLNANLRRE